MNENLPSVDDLRRRARRRIPRFAFEYLDGGCNEDVNLVRNTLELRQIQLRPRYLDAFAGSTLRSEMFGHVYDAPFGIAPIGLQGLVWPRAAEILAGAARDHNLPFILSTVSTSSIETISEITEGRAWFQLYRPKQDHIRDDLIERAAAARCPVLVILCDVPTFGYRPRDIRNGLGLPPRMTLRNLLQILAKPQWALRTLAAGQPGFANLLPYMPAGLDLRQLGAFMDATFEGRLDPERIAPIRDQYTNVNDIASIRHKIQRRKQQKRRKFRGSKHYMLMGTCNMIEFIHNCELLCMTYQRFRGKKREKYKH